MKLATNVAAAAYDARVAARALFRRPSNWAVPIASLALAIGATAALGTAAYRLFLAPLPIPNGERVVALWERLDPRLSDHEWVAAGNFVDWRTQSRSFELLALSEPYSFDWMGPSGSVRFDVALVTEDYFPLMGSTAVRGRLLVPGDYVAGSSAVVLSEATWRDRFGADPRIVGETLILDSVPRIVVGVTSDLPIVADPPSFIAPKILSPEEASTRRSGYWTATGRLRKGVSAEAAEADLNVIAGRLAERYPATNSGRGVAVEPIRDVMIGASGDALLMGFVAIGAVFLVACANVAGAQVAHAIRRSREFAVRSALGASRSRLLAQLAAEAGVLAGASVAAGAMVALTAMSVLRRFAPPDLWQLRGLSVDRDMFLLIAVLGMAAAVLTWGVTALASLALPARDQLAGGHRAGQSSRRQQHLMKALVTAEVALAVTLCVGAALLGRSFAAVVGADRGFNVSNVFVTTVQAWNYFPTPDARARFVEAVTERIAAAPGVEAVGTTSALPLSPSIGLERVAVRVDGPTQPLDSAGPAVRAAAVSRGYFAAVGTRLLGGRAFGDYDREGTPPVAIVNQAFGERLFGHGNPIGRRITFRFAGPTSSREIVGVVESMRHDGLDNEPAPAVYVPHAQAPSGAIHIVVRGTSSSAGAAARREVAAMNPVMPITEETSLERRVANSLSLRKAQLVLLAGFAIVAIVLAAAGVYGVTARAAAARMHELAVRLALGARPDALRRMLVSQAVALAALGTVIGLALSLGTSRLISGFLYGTPVADPVAFSIAAVIGLGVAAAAAWIPASRAARTDPLRSLRAE